jgi:hypothetical protein
MNRHNPPPEGMPGGVGASTPDPQAESNGSLLAPPEVSCEGLTTYLSHRALEVARCRPPWLRLDHLVSDAGGQRSEDFGAAA